MHCYDRGIQRDSWHMQTQDFFQITHFWKKSKLDHLNWESTPPPRLSVQICDFRIPPPTRQNPESTFQQVLGPCVARTEPVRRERSRTRGQEKRASLWLPRTDSHHEAL